MLLTPGKTLMTYPVFYNLSILLLVYFKFIKKFKVTKGEHKYINTTRDSVFINVLAEKFLEN